MRTSNGKGASKRKHHSKQDARIKRMANDNATSRISMEGWTLSAHKNVMSGESELSSLSQALGIHALPEMVFSKNQIVLENGSLKISFNAQDALQGCLRPPEFQNPIRVIDAAKWAEISNAMILKTNHDWTFTTDYAGTYKFITSDRECVFAVAANDEVIKFELLKPPLPILWSSEMILFEDELHDCGQAKLSIRVRVMPGCWFLLLRFWLRIDKVMYRAFETRLFHEFSSSLIIKTTQIRESSWDSLSNTRHLSLHNEDSLCSLLELRSSTTETLSIL